MYAKVFTQILDSSLAEHFERRHIFEDLLKLCDINGVVDMTHEAISRRINVPFEIVKREIDELEKPDPRSRNPDHGGRRIIRLNEHRDWGWSIVNYDLYRRIENEEQRREKTRVRVQKFRDQRNQFELEPTFSSARVSAKKSGNAPVTHCNAGNGMQRKRKMETYKASSAVSESIDSMTTKPKKLSGSAKELADAYEAALASQWRNDSGKWINRIKSNPHKSERVLNELNEAIKEQRIETTPAQYAEQIWGEFV